MARSRYAFDEDKIALFYKEGRGSDRGAAYKPWLTVRDEPSSGRSHRPNGLKTGRVHHLLSDIERDLFFLFDWPESVTDIREQFPLDRQITQRIADQLGIRHPRDTGTQVPLVMTTDLLVDIERNDRSVPCTGSMPNHARRTATPRAPLIPGRERTQAMRATRFGGICPRETSLFLRPHAFYTTLRNEGIPEAENTSLAMGRCHG